MGLGAACGRSLCGSTMTARRAHRQLNTRVRRTARQRTRVSLLRGAFDSLALWFQAERAPVLLCRCARVGHARQRSCSKRRTAQHQQLLGLQLQAFLVRARYPLSLCARRNQWKPWPCKARKKMGQFANRREGCSPEQLYRHAAHVGREVPLDGLRRTRQVRHAQDRLVLVLAHEGKGLAVAGAKELEACARIGNVHLVHVVALPARDHLERQLVVFAKIAHWQWSRISGLCCRISTIG